jgi:hypothetical protein
MAATLSKLSGLHSQVSKVYNMLLSNNVSKLDQQSYIIKPLRYDFLDNNTKVVLVRITSKLTKQSGWKWLLDNGSKWQYLVPMIDSTLTTVGESSCRLVKGVVLDGVECGSLYPEDYIVPDKSGAYSVLVNNDYSGVKITNATFIRNDDDTLSMVYNIAVNHATEREVMLNTPHYGCRFRVVSSTDGLANKLCLCVSLARDVLADTTGTISTKPVRLITRANVIETAKTIMAIDELLPWCTVVYKRALLPMPSYVPAHYVYNIEGASILQVLHYILPLDDIVDKIGGKKPRKYVGVVEDTKTNRLQVSGNAILVDYDNGKIQVPIFVGRTRVVAPIAARTKHINCYCTKSKIPMLEYSLWCKNPVMTRVTPLE